MADRNLLQAANCSFPHGVGLNQGTPASTEPWQAVQHSSLGMGRTQINAKLSNELRGQYSI